MAECISADRVWSLIRENLPLTAAEKEHVWACPFCIKLLRRFRDFATAAGLTISIELPDKPRKKPA